VTWAAGASGSQAFWLALQSSPSSGRLLVQLQQPQGAVLDPDAMSTMVEVQSPVVGFKTDLVGAAAAMLHVQTACVEVFVRSTAVCCSFCSNEVCSLAVAVLRFPAARTSFQCASCKHAFPA
jgi:hypothetical protein